MQFSSVGSSGQSVANGIRSKFYFIFAIWGELRGIFVRENLLEVRGSSRSGSLAIGQSPIALALISINEKPICTRSPLINLDFGSSSRSGNFITIRSSLVYSRNPSSQTLPCLSSRLSSRSAFARSPRHFLSPNFLDLLGYESSRLVSIPSQFPNGCHWRSRLIRERWKITSLCFARSPKKHL